MALEYEAFGPDGQYKLFGLNIFDYDWKITGKRVNVKDPHLSPKPYLRGPAGGD